MRHGQAGEQLDDAVVEERDAALEAHAHGRPVELHQDVVGEVGDGVARHHAGDDLVVGPRRRRRSRSCRRHRRRSRGVGRSATPAPGTWRCGSSRVVSDASLATLVAGICGRQRERDRGGRRASQTEGAPRRARGRPLAREPAGSFRLRALIAGTHAVALVAAEHLVAAVARQADGHVAPGELRHQQRRDLRRVGEGLVVHDRRGVGPPRARRRRSR